jgi:hypothetical protein
MTLATCKPVERSEIGLLLPDDDQVTNRYGINDLNPIEQVLSNYGFNRLRKLRWPPKLNMDYLADLEALDWVILDVGQAAMNSGIVGYLHGRFIPMVRLLKGVQSIEQIQGQTSYQGLYGGVEVGYYKDIITWDNLERLGQKLDERLLSLTAPVRRISSRAASEAYFREASLRKPFVFLSYSGKDAELASQISAELKKRFQKVFDYRDGESITPGEPWLKEIFDKLSIAALGIPLVTSSYLQSGNCEHEAQEMVAERDSGKMAMIPIKLYKEDSLDLPTWMRNRQYMHVYDYPDIPSMVDKLLIFFDSLQEKLS